VPAFTVRIISWIAFPFQQYLRVEKAVQLLVASDVLSRKLGVVIHPIDQPDYDKHVELLKGHMSTEDLERAWVGGANMSVKEVYDYALEA
jgi:hypothetical protein